jgi:hypothetical protein
MYYLPLLVLKERKHQLPAHVLLACYDVYSQEMMNLHFGQGMDIWWHSGKGKGFCYVDLNFSIHNNHVA